MHIERTSRYLPLALAAALVATLIASLFITRPTHADNIDVVRSVTISREDGLSDPPIVGTTQLILSFTIDTTGHSVAGGDTFTIAIPGTLRVTSDTSQNSLTFPMYTADGAEAVSCTVPTGTDVNMVCTFTDYATTHTNITGEGTLRTQAAEATNDTNVSFSVNGRTIPADLPGGSIAAAGERILTHTQKWGHLKDGDPTTLQWEIDVKGSELPTDVTEVTIDDTFGSDAGGYTLKTDGEVALYYYENTEQYQASRGWTILPGQSMAGGTFTFTPKADGSGFTASFPHSSYDGYYVLAYEGTVNNSAITSGNTDATFSNRAVINGQIYDGTADIRSSGSGAVRGNDREVPTPTPSTPPAPSATPTPFATPTPSVTPTPAVSTPPAPSATPTPSAPNPAVTPSSAPTPSATPSPGPRLARTGATTEWLLGGAALLALAGTGAALIGHRRG